MLRALQETAVRYFLEVARTGSIQQAAQRLNVAGSAVSRQIAGLEAALDTPLFNRLPRGMSLTAAGEALATHARRTALEAERVLQEIRALKGDRGGHVRLCSSEGFAADFLPRALADFHARHGGVSFELALALPGNEVSRRILRGEADIGLSFSRASTPGIAVVHSQPAPVLALMRADHPLASARSVSLARLQEYPLALPSADNTLRQLIDLACEARGLQLKPAFSADFGQSLCAFALQGLGITFTAEVSARTFVASGQAVLVRISDRTLAQRRLEIQTLAGRRLPPVMTALLAELVRLLERPSPLKTGGA